jgi:hypothetical protein
MQTRSSPGSGAATQQCLVTESVPAFCAAAGAGAAAAACGAGACTGCRLLSRSLFPGSRPVPQATHGRGEGRATASTLDTVTVLPFQVLQCVPVPEGVWGN